MNLKNKTKNKRFNSSYPTFAVLGSSFTLAVDVGDVRACSYSSSAGSSFTLITGGDGDSTGRVSACLLDWIRKGENSL